MYKINLWPFKQSDNFTLQSSLFGAIKLIKNADFDKYKYSDYGIGFDLHGSFSLVNGNEFGKNAIIFGADMSSVDMSYFVRAILKMYFLRKQFW